MWRVLLPILLFTYASTERLVEVNVLAPAATCTLSEVFLLRIPSEPYTGYLWFFRPLDERKVILLNGLTGTYQKVTERSGYQDFHLKCPDLGRVGSIAKVRLEYRALWGEEALRIITIPVTISA